MAAQQTLTGEEWPALPYEEWKDTLVTLHMWTQIGWDRKALELPDPLPGP